MPPPTVEESCALGLSSQMRKRIPKEQRDRLRTQAGGASQKPIGDGTCYGGSYSTSPDNTMTEARARRGGHDELRRRHEGPGSAPRNAELDGQMGVADGNVPHVILLFSPPFPPRPLLHRCT